MTKKRTTKKAKQSLSVPDKDLDHWIREFSKANREYEQRILELLRSADMPKLESGLKLLLAELGSRSEPDREEALRALVKRVTEKYDLLRISLGSGLRDFEEAIVTKWLSVIAERSEVTLAELLRRSLEELKYQESLLQAERERRSTERYRIIRGVLQAASGAALIIFDGTTFVTSGSVNQLTFSSIPGGLMVLCGGINIASGT